MPRSEEKSVGKNIERLADSHPEFGNKQRVAVAMSESRRAGGDAPPKKEAPKKKPNPKKSMMRAQVLRQQAENGE